VCLYLGTIRASPPAPSKCPKIRPDVDFRLEAKKTAAPVAPISCRRGLEPQKLADACRGFVNRSTIGVGVWRFVEWGEHGGAIRDGGSTILPSFRSHNGGETLRAAINHCMTTSARL
jgi:hypothetical protein